MAKFDIVVQKRNNFKGYTGEPPVDEAEYDARKAEMFDGEAPTWTEVKSEMDNITDPETLTANAKAKLIAGEPLTEEEANVLVGV
tara:strand:- start:1411 stop:1665 length:255 start_codon:yes stop_codon:yes gene_type:complete